MMATPGARVSVSPSSSATSMKPSSTSLSDTRLTVMPYSSATSSAVSESITSLTFIIMP